MDKRPSDPNSVFGSDDPADQFSALWRSGRRPDLDAFIANAGTLSPLDLAALLRIDQAHRWERGERITAEVYLTRYPLLRGDSEAAIDLIYGEFLLAESFGHRPNPEDFVARFPDYSETLRKQIELHRAMDTRPASEASLLLETRIQADRYTPAERALPREFGRYRIIKPLGRGGMGTVYMAHDTQLDREVALKIPRFGNNPDDDVIERFYREARIAANFRHPLLCPVFDVGQQGDIHYLTMPLLRGEPLSTRLQRDGALPENEAARLTARMARALAVAHRAGVIHRDLKPANVLIGEDGEPVIMDFGLARRHTSRDPHLTAEGDLFGTPGYMPPELIGGDASSAGPACDIYSLGVMFYHMLTGRIPFAGSAPEVLRKALTESPDRPSRFRPGLNPRLEAICRKAIAREPGERYRSMDDFAEALESAVSLRDPPTSSIRRGRPAALRLAVVAALIILVGVVLSAMIRGQRTLRPDARDPLTVGSQWTGKFQFRPPLQGIGSDVTITITERNGARLRADYVTEGGRFHWEIAGTASAGALNCKFTRAIRDNDFHDVVGRARLDGTFDATSMNLVFAQSPTEAADMTLRRTAP